MIFNIRKNTKVIYFRNDKTLIPFEDYGKEGEDGTQITLEEYKAIQKQIEELGWLDKRVER